MAQENIEFPALSRHGAAFDGELPRSYKEFKNAWEAVAEETEKRSQTELKSASPEADAAGGLPAALDVALDAAVARTEANPKPAG